MIVRLTLALNYELIFINLRSWKTLEMEGVPEIAVELAQTGLDQSTMKGTKSVYGQERD